MSHHLLNFCDYISAGLIVIATPYVGDASKLIKDKKIGYILESLEKKDIEKFVNEHIHELVKPAIYRSDVQQIYNEFYSLDVIFEKYVSLYNELLEQIHQN